MIESNPLAEPGVEIADGNDNLIQRRVGEDSRKRGDSLPWEHCLHRQRGFVFVMRKMPGVPVDREPTRTTSSVPRAGEGIEKKVRCRVGGKPESAKHRRQRRHQHAKIQTLAANDSFQNKQSAGFRSEMPLTELALRFSDSAEVIRRNRSR